MRGPAVAALAAACILTGGGPLPAALAAQAPAASRPAAPDTAPVPASGPADTLRLGELHDAVQRLDPRARQLPLLEEASRARIRRLDGRWLPSLRLRGEASYQTEVPTAFPAGTDGLPSGLTVPEPPKERYEVGLEAEQLLLDGGAVGRGKAVERARLAERRWKTRTSLHGLREELDRAFFTALLRQERRRQLGHLLEDLGARRKLVAARVRAGSLVPAELAAVDAELVRAEQEMDAAEADRRAALERMSLLLGREIPPGTVLSLPELAAAAASLRREVAPTGPGGAGAAPRVGEEPPPVGEDAAPVRQEPDRVRQESVPWSARPEWNRLERLEERLRAEAQLAEAQTRPRATAFLRGAVGRPGLDSFRDELSPYAMAGVRVSWPFFDGGGSDAEARSLRLEARIAGAEQAALGETLRRQASSVLLEVDRLSRALASDDRLVELEEGRRRTALRRLEEGVLLPSEYVERRTDAFEARLRRRTHRVQLAEARARLLRLLGRSLPAGGGRGLEVPVDAPPPPSPSRTGDPPR